MKEWRMADALDLTLVTKHCSAFIVTSRPKEFAIRRPFIRNSKFAIKKATRFRIAFHLLERCTINF
jgi:hypothetical protein